MHVLIFIPPSLVPPMSTMDVCRRGIT